MSSNFDLNGWATTIRPYERQANNQNIDPEDEEPQGNINWRKYLSQRTLLWLIPVICILIACILQRFFRTQRFGAQQTAVTDVTTVTTVTDMTAVTAVTDSKEVTDITDVTECLWILSSASSVNSFPLLLPVNERLYGDVLHEHSSGTLNELVQNQTKVSLILVDRAQSLIEHFSQAAKVFTYTEYNTVAFQNDINLACKQLEDTYSLLDSLATTYHLFRRSYDIVNAKTASALEESKLTNRTEFMSYAQSWWGAWFSETSWASWKKWSKTMEKVRLGAIALDLEITRLEQIKQVIHLLRKTMQALSTSIHRWQTECTEEAQHNCFPRKVREWFQQNFVHNHELKMIWVELIASVDRGEQKIDLEISNEWCNQSRQAGLGIDSG